MMPSNFLTIVHVNINSISMNLDTLLSNLMCNNFDFDLLCVTETKLSELSDRLFDIPGCSHFSVNRNSHGGGIRVYYKSHLQVTICHEFSGLFVSHEALFVRVNLLSAVWIVGTIYRPPSSSTILFNQYIEHELLSDRLMSCHKVILTGDFNYNINDELPWARSTRNFCSILGENGFRQHVREGTHFCSRTGRVDALLDHFWTNFDQEFSVMIHGKVSDHLPVSLSFPLARKNCSLKCVFRDFSAGNVLRFEREKSHMLRDYVVTNDSEIDDEFKRFLGELSKILNKYFPLREKQVSLKGLDMPWIDGRIRTLINNKHKLFLRLKRKQITYAYFKAYSNLLSYVIGVRKRNHFSSKFTNCENDSAKLWSTINSVFGRKRKTWIHEIKLSDGTIISDKQRMSHEFNKFFINKPKIINSGIQQSVYDYGDLVPNNNKSFRMLPAREDEVIQIMRKLKNSGGGLELPIRFLKMSCEQVAPHVTALFNMSVRQCRYPILLKIARVVPVHKRGDAHSTQNYRPISILPPINKIFEKLIYKRMVNFIDECRLLSHNQYGFRKGMDTGQAALKLIHTVLENYTRGESTACVFLDFSAAFDTLQRETLLHKCYRYGFRGPTGEFLQSYLSDRKQYVSIPTTDSNGEGDLIVNDFGVLQGSCLGPLFYLLYSNDLNFLVNTTPLILFADDSALLVSDKDHRLLAARTNFYLHKLQEWANFNRLALNPEKSKCLFFRAKQQELPPIEINNNEIEIVNTFKYLGFQLDRRLVHGEHVRQLNSKMKRLSYVALKLRRTLNEKAALAFYHGLVQSSLSYGIVIYGGSHTTADMRKLFRLQRKLISLLLQHFNDGLTLNQLMKKYKMMNLNDLYKFNVCVTLFRVLRMNHLPFLFDRIYSLAFFHNHDTRNRANFMVPMPRTRAIQFNFIYQAIASWNSLPLGLREIESFSEFKTKLRRHIFDTY